MIRPYKNREINPHKPVYVYRNLADKHNHLGRWSILQGAHVVAHADDLVMTGFGDRPVEFIVRPGGFKRAQAEQRKNVHAFVKGRVDDRWIGAFDNVVQYDFRRGDRFFDVGTGEDIKQADQVWLSDGEVYYR